MVITIHILKMEEKIFKFELGDEVKDLVTGYKGIIDMRNQCLNKCIQYNIQSRIDKDGKIPDSYMIDEQNLELIKKRKVKPNKTKKFTGGAMRRVERR